MHRAARALRLPGTPPPSSAAFALGRPLARPGTWGRQNALPRGLAAAMEGGFPCMAAAPRACQALA
eukprot:634378-Lingulodinium_polyedra.AAC.1